MGVWLATDQFQAPGTLTPTQHTCWTIVFGNVIPTKQITMLLLAGAVFAVGAAVMEMAL